MWVTGDRGWGKAGRKVYFKLQIHNLEPAEVGSCKIVFVVFLTSIKKQNNVEMVPIPLACTCCQAPAVELSGNGGPRRSSVGLGRGFLGIQSENPRHISHKNVFVSSR